jgi:Zn-dependent protease with chaperone function/type II secretory pathway pseudopilin PulG
MMDLVYKNEKTLFGILLTISVIVWLAFIAGTFGVGLIYVLFGYIFYLFAQSALISYLKGTAVRITPDQFPDLYESVRACSMKLGGVEPPEAYILHADGLFNAFATRFLGRNFIVLFSDVVDALDDNPDALNFYIGHELGHIKRKHMFWAPILFPATWLPLLGAAYSRAREYTCDRHGFAACERSDSAQFGLAALAAGKKRWRTMSKTAYAAQIRDTSGFWMSFHEYLSDYPWMTKRMAALKALQAGQQIQQPPRNPFAGILALFVPRLGVAAGGSSMIVMVAIVGILAAVAIPAYQDYTVRAKMIGVEEVGRNATEAVANYFYANNAVPEDLAKAGITEESYGKYVRGITVDANGVVHVEISIPPYQGKTLDYVPRAGTDKKIVWICSSANIPAKVLPPGCNAR